MQISASAPSTKAFPLRTPAWPKLVTAAYLCYHTSSVLSHPQLLHKQSNPYSLAWQQERCHRLFWCQSLVAVLALDTSMIGHDACNQFTTIIIYVARKCCDVLHVLLCTLYFRLTSNPGYITTLGISGIFLYIQCMEAIVFSLSLCKALPITPIMLWCHGQILISCSLHLLKFAPPTQHLVSLNKCAECTSCLQPIMWAITSYLYYFKVKLGVFLFAV